ncbi:ankyrin repeat-containing domain protein [Xylaria sp. FL1042]|nr:ankyrin repeat-containing domain protein [Xylaria sp. FL1042]
MAHITKLATEILFLILAIGDDQLTSRDVASVARTCKTLCHIATTLLYRHNISEHLSSVLIWASRRNQIRTIEKALAFGADVNTFGLVPPTCEYTRANYGTPLHWAAREGHDNVVRLLLDHNARLDAPSRNFCLCSDSCSPDFNLTPQLRPQWFPLHLAICRRHETTAHIFLDRHAPMRLRAKSPRTPGSGPTIIHCAAARGLDSVVRRALDMYPGILDAGKHEVSERSSSGLDLIASPLHYTVHCWHSESVKSVIRTLVSAGCDLEAEDGMSMTPIWQACRVGNFAIAMYLLAEGSKTRRVPTRASEYWRLEHSGEHLGQISLLQYAVRHESSYFVARHDDQVAFVKALIEEHGHSVHEIFLERESQTPLNAALESIGSTSTVVLPKLIRLLLQKGANPNHFSRYKLSPLFRVVHYLLDLLDYPSLGDRSDSYSDLNAEPAEVCDLELEDDFTSEHGWLRFLETPSWKVHDEEIYKDAAQTSIEDIDTRCGMNLNPWQDEASRVEYRGAELRPPAEVKSDAWEVMAELLKFGAQLDTQFKIECSPLYLAVLSASRDPSKGHSYTLLKFLLENHRGATLSSRRLDKLLRICIVLGPSYKGREAVSCLLIQHGASLDFQNPTIKELLQRRFLEDDDVWLAMLCFQKSCLLQPPEDIMIDALEKDSRRVARYILARSDMSVSKAAQQHHDNTALHVAASRADFDLALLLITRGADVRALNAYNESPLYKTFYNGSEYPCLLALTTAHLLIDNGADPFRRRHRDNLDPTQCICETSIHLTIQRNGSAFSSTLEYFGIQGLNYILEKYQLSSQHPCIICNYMRGMCTVYSIDTPPFEVIDLLLKAGASPNGCGRCAESPMTYCAKELRSTSKAPCWTKHATSRLRLLRSLIAGGADVNQPNADGETAATILAEILSHWNTGKVEEAWDLLVNEVRRFFALKFDDSGKATITCLVP